MVFLPYFKDIPDGRRAGKVIYPLDEILLLRAVAGKTIDRKAACVVARKGNRGTLREDAERFAAEQKANGSRKRRSVLTTRSTAITAASKRGVANEFFGPNWTPDAALQPTENPKRPFSSYFSMILEKKMVPGASSQIR